MQFEGTVIKEQGVTFAIVVVKPTALDSATTRENVRERFSSFFQGMPVVLMSQNGRGIPSYHGRQDIVNFLAGVDPGRIPWKKYTVN